jgi:small subunit ribosomal protein S4
MFKLFYGDIPKSQMKKRIKVILKKKHKKISLLFLELFERRLDTILYRSKFGLSMRNARQLILHGKIFVNKKPIKIKSHILSFGDIITINPKDFKLVKTNIQQSMM